MPKTTNLRGGSSKKRTIKRAILCQTDAKKATTQTAYYPDEDDLGCAFCPPKNL
jgi:hypothetical protein